MSADWRTNKEFMRFYKDRLKAELSKLKFDSKLTLASISSDTDRIVQYALENALQHGGTLGNLSYETFSESNVAYAKIINPQAHPFPIRLLREFFAGEGIDLSDKELGPWGFGGISHKLSFDHLSRLPPGSSVRWEADGHTVTFTLKIQGTTQTN